VLYVKATVLSNFKSKMVMASFH